MASQGPFSSGQRFRFAISSLTFSINLATWNRINSPARYESIRLARSSLLFLFVVAVLCDAFTRTLGRAREAIFPFPLESSLSLSLSRRRISMEQRLPLIRHWRRPLFLSAPLLLRVLHFIFLASAGRFHCDTSQGRYGAKQKSTA